jgi:ABC-type transporter MlaC component
MKKFILFTAILVLIAGGAFQFLTGSAVNNLIKEQIEQVGTKITEQSVTVASVEMKLLEGSGTINGLVLPNPAKYTAPSLFSLNEVTLDINLTSLTTDLIIIDRIILNKPEAVVEFTENAGSNIQDILDAIKKNTASTNQTEPEEKTTPENSVDPIVRVNKFVLAGVALTVDLTKLGNKAHQATLADIVLTNIGGEAGMPASQLGAELTKKALSSIWKQAKKEQTDILKSEIKDKVKDKVKEKLSGFLNKLG